MDLSFYFRIATTGLEWHSGFWWIGRLRWREERKTEERKVESKLLVLWHLKVVPTSSWVVTFVTTSKCWRSQKSGWMVKIKPRPGKMLSPAMETSTKCMSTQSVEEESSRDQKSCTNELINSCPKVTFQLLIVLNLHTIVTAKFQLSWLQRFNLKALLLNGWHIINMIIIIVCESVCVCFVGWT